MELIHYIILLILLGGMAAYVPVFMCLFFTSVVGFVFFTDLPVLLLAQTIFRSMDKFALVVVLFFTIDWFIFSLYTTVNYRYYNMAFSFCSIHYPAIIP